MSASLKCWRHFIFAVLFFAACTFVLTYPVGVRWASHLAGTPGEDALQHLWISWWTQKSLVDLGVSPTQVDWLYYPDGVTHPMLWVTPYPAVSGLPLALGLGLVAGYNVEWWLSFVLAGLSAYLLILYLTRNRFAALLGGFMFAFSPNRVAQSSAHLAQCVTYLFPLCALYLIRLRRKPDLRGALLFGLFLGLSLLVNVVHIAYLILPLLAVFLLYWAIAERKSFWTERVLTFLALGLAVAGLLSAPLLIPFVRDSLAGRLSYLSQGGVNDFSSDLLALVVPAATHPLLSAWPALRDFAVRLIGDGSLRENTVYLGIVPLILGAWVVWRGRRASVMPWALLGLVAIVLSLGPALKVAGHATGLPMPYAAIQRLPFYQWGRIPGRFNETIILALAVLAGFAWVGLSTRMHGGKGDHTESPLQGKVTRVVGAPLCGRPPMPAHSWRAVCLGGALLVVIGLEYWTVWPFPTMDAFVPEFLHDWAADRADFAVLDLPQWPLWEREASNYAMFDQTVHGHKIVGGYVWRLPQRRDGTMKAFQELFWPDGQTDIIARRRGAGAIPLLNQYGIRYVVVHPSTLDPEDRENDVATVSNALGAPLYRSDNLVAFAVPPEASGGAAALEPLTSFGYNWYMVEPIDGKPARWLMNDGSLYVHWLQVPAVPYRLTMNVSPFSVARHLQVSVNGRPLPEVSIEGRTQVDLGPFALERGQNEIAFHVPEGCSVPADTVGNEDRRCLSLLFQDMVLTPAETMP